MIFFYLGMISDISNIFILFCLFYSTFFFFTGEDQAHSANSDGEGTQGAADFRGTESDPTAPLIKQNIPG